MEPQQKVTNSIQRQTRLSAINSLSPYIAESVLTSPLFKAPALLQVKISARELANLLAEYVTPERREKIRHVIEGRTYQTTVVTEGVWDQGNLNAVMRSAEALGFQSIHVIESNEKYKAGNRTASGADKWLDIYRYADTKSAIQNLKSLGYKIYATHLDSTAVPIQTIDFTKPSAIVFGNEHTGITPEMIELSDQRIIIPMSGFTQSFNISVAAAISLSYISEFRKQRLGHQGDLSADEKSCLEALYYYRTVPHPEHLLKAVLTRAGII